MSIATRINAIEEHIGNAYDKLDDLGIDLTNVDKNINNIASLLDTVYEDYPKVQGTGTEATLDGTKVGKLSLDVKGNSTQETTTGKNKLPNNLTSQTKNGLTITVNDDKTIKVNGTATAQVTLTISTHQLEAGSYVLNGCPSGGGENTYEIQCFGGISSTIRDRGTGVSFTGTGDGTTTTNVVIRNGVTVNNVIFKPMIRLSSVTDTTYEPYTGRNS